MKTAGVKTYEGLNQYPLTNPDDFDGTWGIFDGPYLQYFRRKLSEKPQPFFASVFTLSSHQPYTLPKSERGKYPKGPTENLESIQYADNALKEFFLASEKEPWFDNTLFIITGDH
ncbi:MAG: sulfatase-like hydrolase/transferase, partial [Bdellovibrionota bacterium]